MIITLHFRRQLLLFAVSLSLLATPSPSWVAYGQSSERLQAFREFLDRSVSDKKVAGGVVVVYRDNKAVFQSGFGFADVERRKPFQLNTPVVVASISKPLLGTTLYRLVEQGKLDVSKPISNWLPEFSNCKLESGKPVQKPPTVTQLLTHTSGLRNDSAKRGRIWFQAWTRDQSLETVVKKVASEFPFKRQPGSGYAYSGIGTDVAARVGEVASGMPRNQLLKKQLAIPLQMPNTFYLNAEEIRKRKLEMPTRYYFDKKAKQYRKRKRRPLRKDGDYSSSGGGVVSTASDLATWLFMIRDGGKRKNGKPFLRRETVKKMLTKQKGSYNAKGGLFVRRTNKNGKPVKFKHTGSSGTAVWIDLENNLVVIVLTQTSSSSDFQKELEKRIYATFAKP